MKVREVMIAPLVTVTPRTTYEDAAFLLQEYRLNGMPVLDENGHLLGVITEKDLFRALYPRYEEYLSEFETYIDQESQEDDIDDIRKQPIEKYMSHTVITIGPDAHILRAGGLMLAHNVHRLPVVENGKLVGIVTREDIYDRIVERHLGTRTAKKK